MADYVVIHDPELVDDTIDKVQNLAQTTGQGTGTIMSQKAVTDNISGFHEKYTVSVSTSWTLEDDVYTQTISVAGLKAANNYVCGLVPSSTQSNAIAQEEAFCHVNSVTIDNGSLTLTAFPPAPLTAFNLLVLR